ARYEEAGLVRDSLVIGKAICLFGQGENRHNHGGVAKDWPIYNFRGSQSNQLDVIWGPKEHELSLHLVLTVGKVFDTEEDKLVPYMERLTITNKATGESQSVDGKK